MGSPEAEAPPALVAREAGTGAARTGSAPAPALARDQCGARYQRDRVPGRQHLENSYDASFAFSENLGLITTVNAAQLLAAGALGVLAFHWFWSHREAAAEPDEATGIFLWALTGLGLIAFAFDDFFGLHERLGAWITDHIGVLPLLTNNAADAITLGYGVACLVVLAAFRQSSSPVAPPPRCSRRPCSPRP